MIHPTIRKGDRITWRDGQLYVRRPTTWEVVGDWLYEHVTYPATQAVLRLFYG